MRKPLFASTQVLGQAKLSMLAVICALLFLGALGKLVHIAYSTPTSGEINESVLMTKELKKHVCGVSTSDRRINVDPCGGKDVRFRATNGLTFINVYGILETEDFTVISQRAKQLLEKSDLTAVELAFRSDLMKEDSNTMATIRLNKETSNANR